MKEAVLLQSLRHPNVVPFVGITVQPHQLRLISKWMKHGHITGYLKNNPEASKVDLVSSHTTMLLPAEFVLIVAPFLVSPCCRRARLSQ
jgi:hypothetical protein